MPESHIRYRLAGESLAAAKIARNFLATQARHLEWFERTPAFIAAHPAEAALLGLDHPTVQVGDCGGHFRAYRTFPTLYHAQDKNFYLDCPIDHEGQHFSPKDAAALNAKQEVKSWQHLYGGMGENIPPILHIMPEGVAAPKTAAHLSDEIDYGGRILHISMRGTYAPFVYLPDATALATLKTFKREEAAFTKSVEDLTAAVSGIIAALTPQMQARQEKKMPIRPSLYFNDAEKTLQLRLDNAYLPDHPALEIKDSRRDFGGGHDGVTFKLRPNMATPEGQQLAALFNAVGKKPSLAEALGLPENAYPQFVEIGGDTRLLTRVAAPGFVAEKNKDWILRDQEDAAYKVKAPPRPF